MGIDAAAHRGCLDQGGYTTAVLPCGLDHSYPPQHRELAAQIAAAGCLLSEYPPGIQPARYRFVERDRLQSGLSDLVIVVETEMDGGAMHTARFARRQGRMLLVFSPAGLDSNRASGNRRLIETGATAVESVEAAMAVICTLQPGNPDPGALF